METETRPQHHQHQYLQEALSSKIEECLSLVRSLMCDSERGGLYASLTPSASPSPSPTPAVSRRTRRRRPRSSSSTPQEVSSASSCSLCWSEGGGEGADSSMPLPMASPSLTRSAAASAANGHRHRHRHRHRRRDVIDNCQALVHPRASPGSKSGPAKAVGSVVGEADPRGSSRPVAGWQDRYLRSRSCSRSRCPSDCSRCAQGPSSPSPLSPPSSPSPPSLPTSPNPVHPHKSHPRSRQRRSAAGERNSRVRSSRVPRNTPDTPSSAAAALAALAAGSSRSSAGSTEVEAPRKNKARRSVGKTHGSLATCAVPAIGTASSAAATAPPAAATSGERGCTSKSCGALRKGWGGKTVAATTRVSWARGCEVGGGGSMSERGAPQRTPRVERPESRLRPSASACVARGGVGTGGVGAVGGASGRESARVPMAGRAAGRRPLRSERAPPMASARRGSGLHSYHEEWGSGGDACVGGGGIGGGGGERRGHRAEAGDAKSCVSRVASRVASRGAAHEQEWEVVALPPEQAAREGTPPPPPPSTSLAGAEGCGGGRTSARPFRKMEPLPERPYLRRRPFPRASSAQRGPLRVMNSQTWNRVRRPRHTSMATLQKIYGNPFPEVPRSKFRSFCNPVPWQS